MHDTTDTPTEREVFLELSGSSSKAGLVGPRSGLVGHRLPTDDGTGNGMFAEWRYDGETFELSTDRYGLYPLYYAESGGRLRLATSIPALVRAGVQSELDEEALAVFFRLGFFVGNDTPFKSIRALPPGARLSWTPSGLEIKSRLPNVRRLDIDRDTAIEHYADLFRSAVERLFHGANGALQVLPLSGGQDSRHTLLQLLELGHPPSLCVTTRHYPPRGTPDSDVARDVARATGVDHRVLEQPVSQLQAVLRHHAATNLCSLTPGFFMHAVNDFVTGRSALVYDGLAGDVLSAGLFASKERARAFDEGRLPALAEDILANFEGGGGQSEHTLEHTLDEATLRRFSHDVAVGRLCRELERHSEAVNPMLSFCFFNRTRRDVALLPCRVLANAFAVRTPYLDREVFDFLSALPAEICVDRTFHKDTITRRFPNWAELPFAGYFVADDTRAREHFRRFASEVLGYTQGGRGIPGLRRASVVPRLSLCVAGGRYAKTIGWFGPFLLYMQELENLRVEGTTLADG